MATQRQPWDSDPFGSSEEGDIFNDFPQDPNGGFEGPLPGPVNPNVPNDFPGGGPIAQAPTAPQAQQPAPKPGVADLRGFNQEYGFGVDPSDTAAYLQGRLSMDDITSRMNRRAGPSGPSGPRDDSYSTGGEAGSSGGQAGPPQGPSQGFGGTSLKDALAGMFSTGGFNQDIVNRRTSNARDTLNTQRKSSMASNEAYLASRGLIGDGPQRTAQGNLDERLDSQFNTAANDIFANESGNADSRMIQSLAIGAGMSAEEARNLVDQFRANTERTGVEGNLALGNKRLGLDESLGMGQLALGNMNAQNNFTLGQGGLNLGYDQLQHAIDSGNTDELIRLLQLYMQGAGQSADGHI